MKVGQKAIETECAFGKFPDDSVGDEFGLEFTGILHSGVPAYWCTRVFFHRIITILVPNHTHDTGAFLLHDNGELVSPYHLQYD